MPVLRMEQTQSLQMRQELRQIMKMEQAALLEMPEDEFHKLVTTLERSPLFQRLYRRERLIRYQRFPGTDLSPAFYQLDHETLADKGSLDVETLLRNREHIVHHIQELGLERFKRYFLFPEGGMTLEEIAAECDLEVAEVQKINSLIDEFSIMSEFYHPSSMTPGGIRYSKVASVEKNAEGFVVAFLSASSARGRYLIDYERFEGMSAAGALTEAESREARQLFRRLELISRRKDTLTRILHNIVDRQAIYLESGNSKSLLPFSQRELAGKIGVDASSVSRAIRGKSIETPWGREVPLKDFFPRPKKFKKELLRQLLETNGYSSDEAIRAGLWEKFGVATSRRSVAYLRQELQFPAAGKKPRRLT